MILVEVRDMAYGVTDRALRTIPAASVIQSSTASQIPQVIGAGPFRLNVFSPLTGTRTFHRFESAEGRQMFREEAERFALVIEESYDVR